TWRTCGTRRACSRTRPRRYRKITRGGGPMILRELSELPGVSGDEGRVRERIWQAVRGVVDGGKVDAMGNLITWKGLDKPGPRLMIAAHMDEVGLMVTRVDREGLLRFKKVGGIDDRVL